ncbi:hypothetical protein ACIBM4_17535 [Streptomyces sp. NPDC050256]|uniref:hypothetical protein n=1 Tax=unclassified Streptomyces TaxID=2593676 RepID=UPI0037BAAB1E
MVYLVHIHLLPHAFDIGLPGGTAAAIAAVLPDDMGIRHISLHAAEQPAPVLGVYLESRTLAHAESSARTLWETAADALPWLREWSLLRAEVPLMPAAY